jgi:hypothetical protein
MYEERNSYRLLISAGKDLLLALKPVDDDGLDYPRLTLWTDPPGVVNCCFEITADSERVGNGTKRTSKVSEKGVFLSNQVSMSVYDRFAEEAVPEYHMGFGS